MRRLTIFLGMILGFIWSINAQNANTMDFGDAGKVTIVNKGTSTIVTIDTDSIERIMQVIASELVDGMGVVMEELSKSMELLSKEMEKSMEKQAYIQEQESELLDEKSQTATEEQLAEMKLRLQEQREMLKAQQEEMRKQIATQKQQYKEQLQQMEQFAKIKEIYLENTDVLENLDGELTIEISEPVMRSSSISKQRSADTTNVKIVGKSVVRVIDGNEIQELTLGGDNNIYIAEKGNDTVEVRIGKKILRVTDKEGEPKVLFDEYTAPDEVKTPAKTKGKFKGHWSFFEMGMNAFTTPDYTMYGGSVAPAEFLEQNYNKAIEVNINPFHTSIGIINGRSKNSAKLGIVTGLGFSFNNYVFDNNITLAKNNGRIEPVDLMATQGIDAKKTKLTTSYINLPVALEFTFPGNDLFVSAGVTGGLKLGSHTKYKTDSKKEKEHGDFYLNPFRYGVTARVGYKGLSIFGTYYMSEMFREGKGPATTPFSIGIGIM